MGLLFPKVCDESRKVHLDQSDNIFCNNKVDTTKYNLLTFLPKSLLFQFFRLSNVVFLVNTILQSVPIISSLSPITAVGPLAFVLGVSMLREGYEDYVIAASFRKGTKRIGKSTRAQPEFSGMGFSLRPSGTRSKWEIMSKFFQGKLSRLIFCCSTPRRKTQYVMLRPLIWTGKTILRKSSPSLKPSKFTPMSFSP